PAANSRRGRQVLRHHARENPPNRSPWPDQTASAASQSASGRLRGTGLKSRGARSASEGDSKEREPEALARETSSPCVFPHRSRNRSPSTQGDVIHPNANLVRSARGVVPRAGDDVQVNLAFLGRNSLIAIADQENLARFADPAEQRSCHVR